MQSNAQSDDGRRDSRQLFVGAFSDNKMNNLSILRSYNRRTAVAQLSQPKI